MQSGSVYMPDCRVLKNKTKHEAEWQKLWEGDIQIEGDPQVQQDVHNMLYHVYSFHAKEVIHRCRRWD